MVENVRVIDYLSENRKKGFPKMITFQKDH